VRRPVQQRSIGHLWGSAFDRANREEVTIANRSNIRFRKGDYRLSAPRSGHKLNFEAIGVVGLDDRTKVSAAQRVLRNVPRWRTTVSSSLNLIAITRDRP
jgi:hypothetical protein